MSVVSDVMSVVSDVMSSLFDVMLSVFCATSSASAPDDAVGRSPEIGLELEKNMCELVGEEN